LRSLTSKEILNKGASAHNIKFFEFLKQDRSSKYIELNFNASEINSKKSNNFTMESLILAQDER
jgi:hypothetical protein